MMEVAESFEEPKTRKLKLCSLHSLPKCQDCIRERKRINSKNWRERKKADKETVTGVPVTNHALASSNSLRFLPYGPVAFSQEALFNDFFGIEPTQETTELTGSVKSNPANDNNSKESPPQSLPGSPDEAPKHGETHRRTFTILVSSNQQPFTIDVSVDTTKSFYESLLQVSNQLSTNGGLVTARDLHLYVRTKHSDGKTTDVEIDPHSLVQQTLKDFSPERDSLVVKQT